MDCPICNYDKFGKIFTCADNFVSGEEFEIVACQNCGFRWTNHFPPGDTINRYYEADAYISHSDTRKGLINRLYHSVRALMLQQKANWVAQNVPNNSKKLLDVGCGTGYFPAQMQQKGWDVVAVEKNENARRFAENQFRISTFDSLQSVDQNWSQNPQYDAITLWHVLEHLEQLNESMQWFCEHLHNQGALFIAVPNCASVDAKKYKQFWAAYDVPRHLWHFAPRQMQLLAQKHGFQIVSIRPFHFDGFYISMMSEKYKKSRFPFMGGLITGFSTFFLSLFNKKNSSSLLYVLKKSGAE